MTEVWHLKPLTFISGEEDFKPVLIVLNQPIDHEIHLFKRIWKNAILKVFVDGASNRIYESLGEDRANFIPDLITGDFDSINDDVLTFYENKGSQIINTPDQDFTDFTKSLQTVLKHSTDQQSDAILVMNSFDGRLDHVFANINSLYEMQPKTSKPIYCFSSGNLACLIRKGKTKIELKNEHKVGNCGLIPVGQPALHVTTTGLKWNLENQRLKFAELISTSNTYDDCDGDVSIETDEALLWTMQYTIH